ncbi:hypothetical protein DFJ74DRAFT_501546 [Hyaloraphidium curvatum]|nr:hypothetical protein DFJ74DRAFT_501546 [Hyaloraphidium curvatum]
MLDAVERLPPSLLEMPWAWASLMRVLNRRLSAWSSAPTRGTLGPHHQGLLNRNCSRGLPSHLPPQMATKALVGIRPPERRRTDNAFLHGYLHALCIIRAASGWGEAGDGRPGPAGNGWHGFRGVRVGGDGYAGCPRSQRPQERGRTDESRRLASIRAQCVGRIGSQHGLMMAVVRAT